MRKALALTIAGLLAGALLALTPAAGAATTSPDQALSQTVGKPAGPTLERARRYYGAIALSYDNTVTGKYDVRTKARAKRAALRKCQRLAAVPDSCRTVVWVRNGCAAVSVRLRDDGTVAKYGWGTGRTKAVAKRRALRAVPGSHDRIRAWLCTTRRF